MSQQAPTLQLKDCEPERARIHAEYLRSAGLGRNVTYRLLDDARKWPIKGLSASRFRENLLGDPSALSDIYMPLGLEAHNIFKIQRVHG